MIREVHRSLLALSNGRLWAAIFFARALFVLLILLAFRGADPHLPGDPAAVGALVGSPYLLAYALVLAPLGETLLECSLPHLVMRNSITAHPWIFVTASAALMVLIHPIGWTLSLAPALTGFTLAYCYLNFYRRHSSRVAFAATCAMHITINITGAGLMVLSWNSAGAA